MVETTSRTTNWNHELYITQGLLRILGENSGSDPFFLYNHVSGIIVDLPLTIFKKPRLIWKRFIQFVALIKTFTHGNSLEVFL